MDKDDALSKLIKFPEGIRDEIKESITLIYYRGGFIYDDGMIRYDDKDRSMYTIRYTNSKEDFWLLYSNTKWINTYNRDPILIFGKDK